MQFLRVMGTAAVLTSAAAMADAASCTTIGPGNSGSFVSLDNAISAACFGGNDTNQINASFSLFGKTGWMLADKNDDSAVGSPITFTATGPINGDDGGDWGVVDWAGRTTGDVVITLKPGHGFGAFLVDTDYFSGTWLATKGLSHASIYYRGVTPVPLPAGGILLLSALAGLGFARYRRT